MADRELPDFDAAETFAWYLAERRGAVVLPDTSRDYELPAIDRSQKGARNFPKRLFELPLATATSLTEISRHAPVAGLGDAGWLNGRAPVPDTAPPPQLNAVSGACGPYTPAPVNTARLNDAVAAKLSMSFPVAPAKPILPGTSQQGPFVNGVTLRVGGILDEQLEADALQILQAACDAAPKTMQSAVNPTLTSAQCVASAIAWGLADYQSKLAIYQESKAKWDAAVSTVSIQLANLDQYFCEWLQMVYTAVPAKDVGAGELPVSTRYGDVPEPPVGYEFLSFDTNKKKPLKHNCGSKTTFTWPKVRTVVCTAGDMKPANLAANTTAAWKLVFHFTKKSHDFYKANLKPLLDKEYLRLVLTPQWQTMMFGWEWNSTFDLANPQTAPLHHNTWVQLVPYYGKAYGDDGLGINWGPVLRTSLVVLQARAATLAGIGGAGAPSGDSGAVWVLPWGCQLVGSPSELLNKQLNRPPSEFLEAVKAVFKRNDGQPSYWNSKSDLGAPILHDWPVASNSTGGGAASVPTRLANTISNVKLKKLNSAVSAPNYALVSFSPVALGLRAAALPNVGPTSWLSQWYVKFYGALWIPSMSGANVKKVCNATWTAATKPVAWPWWWALSSPQATFLHIPQSCVPQAIGDGYSCLSFENGCKEFQKNLLTNPVKLPSTTQQGSSYAPYPCIYFD